jgi:high-affinity Fe2+/Pb2+ permease
MSAETQKPRHQKGSGILALICGGVASWVAFGFYKGRFTLESLSPQVVMSYWLFFIAVMLVYWGLQRLITGRGGKGWFLIGQTTILFVVSLAATTFALFTLLISATKQ